MSHHHHHHDHCCDEHTCCCCHEGVCGSSHHHHHEHENHEDFAHQLIEMADQAWMELLKEKIKEQIQTSSGGQLDQLAKLVSEANHMRWSHKMALQKSSGDYKDKLTAFFNQKK